MRTISLLYALSKSKTSRHALKKSRADILIHKAKLPAVPVRICRTQSTIPAGESHAKMATNPEAVRLHGPPRSIYTKFLDDLTSLLWSILIPVRM